MVLGACRPAVKPRPSAASEGSEDWPMTRPMTKPIAAPTHKGMAGAVTVGSGSGGGLPQVVHGTGIHGRLICWPHVPHSHGITETLRGIPSVISRLIMYALPAMLAGRRPASSPAYCGLPRSDNRAAHCLRRLLPPPSAPGLLHAAGGRRDYNYPSARGRRRFF